MWTKSKDINLEGIWQFNYNILLKKKNPTDTV